MVPNPLVGFFQNCNPRVNFTTMLLKTVPILLGVAMIIVIVQLCGASTIVQSKNRFIDDPLADEERTFLMIKPDGVERGLVSEVIKRFEQKGFKLVGIKVKVPDQELLKQHYAEHALKPFFGSMIEYMSMGPVVPMVWEGLNAVNVTREMIGGTHRDNEPPGTIRGDFSINTRSRNVIHGSDSTEAAQREIKLWFSDDELIKFKFAHEDFLYN